MLQDVLLALQLTNEAVGAFWTDLSVLVDTSLQKPDVLWKKRMNGHCHTETILWFLLKEQELNSKTVLAIYGLKGKHVPANAHLSLRNKLYL